MGWTWALFFANQIVAHLVRMANLDAKCSLEMREKLPVPQLWEAPSITSTYVDTVAIVGPAKLMLRSELPRSERSSNNVVFQ